MTYFPTKSFLGVNFFQSFTELTKPRRRSLTAQ